MLTLERMCRRSIRRGGYRRGAHVCRTAFSLAPGAPVAAGWCDPGTVRGQPHSGTAIACSERSSLNRLHAKVVCGKSAEPYRFSITQWRSAVGAAGGEVQLEIDGQLGWPYQAHVVAQDRDAAAVSLLAQALEDLLPAIGVCIQQPCDAALERVEEASALRWAGPLETRSCQPLGDGLAVKTERARNLGDGQALAIPARILAYVS
jgi:hypothetical protein